MDGNCGADELDKKGADMRKPHPDFYATFNLRCELTVIMQNYFVDIWTAET